MNKISNTDPEGVEDLRPFQGRWSTGASRPVVSLRSTTGYFLESLRDDNRETKPIETRRTPRRLSSGVGGRGSCRDSRNVASNLRRSYRFVSIFSFVFLGFILVQFVYPSWCGATSPEIGTLLFRLVLDADTAPPQKPVEITTDLICMPEDKIPKSEALLVDPATMGIKNFVVVLDDEAIAQEAPSLSKTPTSASQPETVELETDGCRFSPHLFAVRIGQSIRIVNKDQFGHTTNFVFFRNEPFTRLQPPSSELSVEPKLAERFPTPIQCYLHPWMKAYALVIDHPWYCISDEQGIVRIENIPVGREVQFRLWHENLNGKITGLAFADRKAMIDQSRFMVRLKPGENDLGTLYLPPTVFLNSKP